MDSVEQRIREVFAILLSNGAKALERSARELQQVASQLRPPTDRPQPDDAWAEEAKRKPDTVIRSTPLRAVPNTPTDEPDTLVRPPREAPQLRRREGDIDAVVTTSPTLAGPPNNTGSGSASNRMRTLADGTVSQVRAQLAELSTDDLRALREAELAGRNRTTLIAAIDRALLLHD
jgi:hypothetical protein